MQTLLVKVNALNKYIYQPYDNIHVCMYRAYE